MTADQSLPDFIIVDQNREVMLEFIGGSIYDTVFAFLTLSFCLGLYLRK